MSEQLHQALLNRAKLHNQLDSIKQQLKSVGTLRARDVAGQRIILGQRLQKAQADYYEAQAAVEELSK